MHPSYEPFHKQAVDLQYKFHDMLDDRLNPTAQILQKEVHSLAEDIQAEKHPRDIENRIKIMQQQLIQAKAQAGTQPLSYQDNDYLHHNYEQMRVNLQHLPNY